MASFGIYILTYPGDFHLSIPLIQSIKYFHPDISITIIPGEGFDYNNHPFDVPVMAVPSGFWSQLGHIDRKFWAFQGDFDTFLYLDADIICTRTLSSLIDRINNLPGRFVAAKIDREADEWRSVIENPSDPNHGWCMAWVKRGLGNTRLMKIFDTDYNPYGRMPFCAGIFAGSRLAIAESDFMDLFYAEKAFYKNNLNSEFNWRSADLFYRDQGRLNYLVDKLNVPLVNLHPDGNDAWAGDEFITKSIGIEDVRNGSLPFSFIHWAGVPRPTPSFLFLPVLNVIHRVSSDYYYYTHYSDYPDPPGYKLWLYFQKEVGYGMSLPSRLRWTIKDIKSIARNRKIYLMGLLKKFMEKYVIWRFR